MTNAKRSANEFCGVRVSVWGVVYDTIAAAPNGAASPGTRRTSAPPYGGVLSCLGLRAGQYQVGVEKTPLSMFCNVGREALLAPPMGHPAVRPPLRAALARSPGSCQLRSCLECAAPPPAASRRPLSSNPPALLRRHRSARPLPARRHAATRRYGCRCAGARGPWVAARVLFAGGPPPSSSTPAAPLPRLRRPRRPLPRIRCRWCPAPTGRVRSSCSLMP